MTDKIQIVSTPHKRPVGQTINNIPATIEEFYRIVNDADWPELKAFGFRKWDTMNNVIGENILHKDESKIVSIPTFSVNSPEDAADLIKGVMEGDIVKADGSMLMDLAPKEVIPMKLLDEDEDIILFPGEWYNIIPDGFKCTSLYGEITEFIKGKSDNDIRFGCIAFGIRRKVINHPKD